MKKIGFNSQSTIKKLEELYPGNEYKKRARQLNNEKRRVFILTLILGIVLALIYNCYFGGRESIEKLKRNLPGAGKRDVRVNIYYGETDIKDEKIITVEEKRYSDEELMEYSDNLEKIIWEIVKGSNASLDEITGNLDVPSSIDGYPFDISYKSDKPLLLSGNGTINRQKLKEEIEKRKLEIPERKLEEASFADDEGIPVRLCVSLSYDDFREDIYQYIILREDKSRNLSSFKEDIDENIRIMDQESRSLDYQILPRNVDGIDLRYETAESYESVVIVVISIICAFGLVLGKDKELDKRIRERNEELDRDYPKILNQYSLYYSAGMSHRRIWQEICNRYEKELKEGGKRKCVYEEMLRTNRRMTEGMGEIESYEEFAVRCHMVKYRAFINLIEQSVKKGRDRLDMVLNEEVEKARRQENNHIRMVSQELSTKLLLPMMMMLIIVLVIVMVPAFMSFNNG